MNSTDNKSLSKMRRAILECASKSGEGHVPSALSILDILWVLYNKVMKTSAAGKVSAGDDRFVLSKGHASLALYAVLADRGLLNKEELDSFCSFDSILGGHPDCTKVAGVEASTGSLGHGLPIAVGIALGSKIKNGSSRIFCLIGDGESNEGTIWESALLASEHRLSNLCCIVDYNHSTDRALGMGDISKKFSAFGWHAINVDGHDHLALTDALLKNGEGLPVAVIAETVKGKGIKEMENNPAWHHKSPTAQELALFLEQCI